MSYRVNFTDNSLVTAEFLNSVTEELGGSALAFADDMLYGVDDLNGIAEALIKKGVSRGCGLSVSEGNVTIAAGVLFMPDGRKVVIDSEGVTLTFAVGSVNYVWFYKDELTGFVAPRCTTEAPSGEYVLLGQVTAEGAVSGRPEIARMKNSYLGLHGTESFTESFLWDGDTEEKILWEYELQDAGYQMITAYSKGYTTSSGLVYNAFCGSVNLATGVAFSTLQVTLKSTEDALGYSYASDTGELFVSLSGLSAAGFNYYKVYLRFELGTDKVLRVYQRATASGVTWYNTSKAAEITITVS